MRTGWTGISFPFRIGNRGGVVLSSTSRYEVPHITESITQILGTRFGERVMEPHLFCDLDTFIFEPNDEATHELLRYEIKEALTEHEPRIEVEDDDIHIEFSEGVIIANISFNVINYGSDKHTISLPLGGENI